MITFTFYDNNTQHLLKSEMALQKHYHAVISNPTLNNTKEMSLFLTAHTHTGDSDNEYQKINLKKKNIRNVLRKH